MYSASLCVRVCLLQTADNDLLASLTELEEALRDTSPADRTENRLQRFGHHQECVYYLMSYGTHLSLVSFYLRHDCLKDALTYLLSKVTRTIHAVLKYCHVPWVNELAFSWMTFGWKRIECLVVSMFCRSVQKTCFWRACSSRVWNEADWASCRGSWRVWMLRWRAGGDT